MKTTLGMRAALLGSGAALALIASPAFAGQVDDLKSQIDQLQSQLDQLEQQKAQANGSAAVDPNADPTATDDQSSNPRQPQQVKATINAITPGAADAVVGGDIPRSFKLPGSDTSVAIKMLIKADFIYDFDQQLGDSAQWFLATPKGVVQTTGELQNRGGQFRFDARFSRLTFETRTPTDYGPLSTFIDGDFWGGLAGPGAIAGSGGFGNAFVTNSYLFELRDAFATLGPILVGQFITNILDPEAYGELLDHFGPPGETVTVQTQVRYTQNWGKFTFSASAENPQSDWTASDGRRCGVPRYGGRRGHLRLRFLDGENAGLHGRRAIFRRMGPCEVGRSAASHRRGQRRRRRRTERSAPSANGGPRQFERDRRRRRLLGLRQSFHPGAFLRQRHDRVERLLRLGHGPLSRVRRRLAEWRHPEGEHERMPNGRHQLQHEDHAGARRLRLVPA